MQSQYSVVDLISSSPSQQLSVISNTRKVKSKSKTKKSGKKINKQSNNSYLYGQEESSSFDGDNCPEECKPLLKYFDEKQCEICRIAEDGTNMILCDKCEDGYHTGCLNIRKKDVENITWICPNCVRQQNQANTITKDIQIEITQKDINYCRKCKKFIQNTIQVKAELDTKKQSSKKILLQLGIDCIKISCLYCKRFFHRDCFSIRTNSLNCSICQRKIRRQCPKSHQLFLQYYKQKSKIFKEKKYFTLASLPMNLRCKKGTYRQDKKGLRLPTQVANWQLITQYEASIYYAFQTKKLDFTEQQIYDDAKVMELNRWDGESTPILELHEEDQITFQNFKTNTKNGAIVGPYEIKQDRVKGFHIVASDFIKKMTIITEYVGEVVPARKSLFHHNQNDSVFILVRNPRSSLSLDIVPHHFGNIGRFFSGINNKSKKSRRLLNVKALRFSYQGRVRIIFHADKDIQAGDELFFDYNGGIFHEYPTQNFKT